MRTARLCLAPLLILVFLAPAHAQADKPKNLVTNGDFEQVDDDGAAVGWDRFKKHFAEVAEEDGNKFLRITSSAEGTQPMVSQKVTVPEGTEKVWVSVRMRTAKINIGTEGYENPRVQMSHYDAEGKLLGYGWSPKLLKDSDWVTISNWYPLKEGAHSIGLGCGFNNSTGVADFDNLIVSLTGPAEEGDNEPAEASDAAKQGEAKTDDKPALGSDENPVRTDAVTAAPGGDGLRPGNLVQNGDFTQTEASGSPTAWTHYKAHFAELIEEDGNTFLRIRNDNKASSKRMSQRIEIPEGLDRVHVSVRMRGKDLDVGEKAYQNARVQMAHFDAEGKLLGYSWSPKLTEDAEDWLTIANWYPLKTGAKYVGLSVGFIESTGVADFDDIHVSVDKPGGEAAQAVPLLPAPEWDAGIAREIHVNPTHAEATDDGEGSIDRLFASLAKAVEAADASKRENIGTRLVIHPGEYREPIRLQRMQKGQDTQAPLVIEAATPGTVMILGSDRWVEGWTPVEGKPGIYQHDWPHDWGTIENPWGDWQNERGTFHVPVPEIARRYEAVFVNDAPLRQYLDPDKIHDGSFYVDEEGDRLLVDFPGDLTPEQTQPDVSLRNKLLFIKGRTNITLRGLTLKHAASGISRGYTALIVESLGITVEDFTSTLNNAGGLGSNRVDHYTWRNVKLTHNGIGGGGIGTSRRVDVDGLEISFNNWRGDWGGWATWHPCGMKNMANDGFVMRNVTARGNLSHGLWMDWQNENVLIENLVSYDNVGYGFYNEANPGPVTLRNAIITNNRDGIHHANSQKFTLENSYIVNNRNGAISLRERVGRYSVSRFTGVKTVVSLEDWTLRNNVIVQDSGGFLLLTPGLANHWETLKTQRNLWYTPNADKAFVVKNLGYSFEDWQLLTGTALDGFFGPPHIAGDAASGFAPAADSPLHRRDSWPTVTVENPGLSAIANKLEARIAATWRETYAVVKDAEGDRFVAVTLGDAVNRPVRTKGGWINMPITQIKPGRHTIHGIPFDLADEADHNGHAGVMLASQRFGDTDGRALPKLVELPVGRAAEAVYVLHVAGYAQTFARAATYTLVYDDGTEEAIGIDVLGGDIDDVEEESAGGIIAKAELQDWWPSNRQFSHENSRRVMVTAEGDPMSAARFLYTTQLTNPHPEKPIKQLRLTSPGDTEATVMVLAVTLLALAEAAE